MEKEVFGIQEIIILLIFLIPIAIVAIGSYLDSKKEKEKFCLELKEYTIVYTYASFGSRLWAHIIDMLIITIPSYIIPIIPAWLYWTLQESGKQRTTVGKKSQKLYVMTTNGKRLSFGSATLRFIVLMFTMVLTISIGFLFMLTNKKRQCIHDLITDTVVVKEVQRIPRNSPI